MHKSLICRILLLAFSLLPFFTFSQDVDLDIGKKLFRDNCNTCHNANMKDASTGPALGTSEENWAEYPREDLYAWIRNSQALLSTGHPRATAVYNEYKTVMTPFPSFTDAEIENIMGYITCVYTGDPACVKVDPGGPVFDPCASPIVIGEDNRLMYISLFVFLAILAIVLARIVSNLNYLNQVNEGNEAPERKTLKEVLTSKGFVSFVLFSILVIGGFTTVNNAINLGRQQGYQPEQPIKFSHKTHACLHQIDCQYCHDGARRSKHSLIPAANTCMNCHKAIKNGSTYGTAELTKIYASIGFNPSNDQYIPDYENKSEEEILDIYKKWITDEYTKENQKWDAEGEALLDEQLEGIKVALTDPESGDNSIAGPIEWIKIHNLPDHVYFNHSQHVTVGKIECQQCHGKVEFMEEVEQYSPLSMGWCINCHRKTEVQFADNDYYNSYKLYHDELAKNKRDGVTVEDIGGLECQKCHY